MKSFSCLDAFVTLATQELETAVAFYANLLGSEPQIYIPQKYAEFLLSGLKLALFQPKLKNQAEFERCSDSGSMSLCLEIEDLDATIAHLATLGYPPPGSAITASHGREIYAYDPDGNRLILHQANST